MAKTATEKYQTQQIMTASPARLVAMLFEKAISCLNEAIRAIEAGDIQARWKANSRAMEIINHLLTRGSLQTCHETLFKPELGHRIGWTERCCGNCGASLGCFRG